MPENAYDIKQTQIRRERERERERERVGTLWEGEWSLELNATIWASRSEREVEVAEEGCKDLGRRNLSKIAITRNIEMRMAVATNPNDTALTELSKCFQLSSFSKFSGATSGGGTVAQLFPSPLIDQTLASTANWLYVRMYMTTQLYFLLWSLAT